TRKPPECCALQLFDRITSHRRSPLAATNQLLLKKGLCKRSIEMGPGAILAGAGGAIVFGVAGYFGAEWVANKVSPK
ncbi:MAG: hypothetical protein WA624_15190, partial [Methylocella sp.]